MTGMSNIWENDLLSRQVDANLLYLLTVNRTQENKVAGKSGAFVVNVDATWGSGKTFLLNGMFEKVTQADHPAIFINAWQYDFVEDPYSIVVSAFDEYFKSIEGKVPGTLRQAFKKTAQNMRTNFGAIAIATGKEVGKTLVKKVFSEGGEAIAEAVSADPSNNGESDKPLSSEVIDAIGVGVADLTEKAIDKFAKQRLEDLQKTKASIDNFKKNLALLVQKSQSANNLKLPFYVFIDELDRCRPTYAIAMLERIKHLFDVTGIVFVLATDTDQLAHSINAVYGENFDSKQYLQRFFHRSYRLSDSSFFAIAQQMIVSKSLNVAMCSIPPSANIQDSDAFAYFLSITAGIFELSVRQFEQSLEILRDIITVWQNKYKIELVIMYPYICEYSRKRNLTLQSNSDIDRTIANASSWTAQNNDGTIEFKKYFNLFRDLSANNIYEWIRRQTNSATISYETSYVYEYARSEYQNISRNVETRKDLNSMISQYQNVIINNRGFYI